MVELPLREIFYFQSDQRTATAHLAGDDQKECRCYVSMTDLAKELEDVGFLRVQRSYLVTWPISGGFSRMPWNCRRHAASVSEKYYAQLKQQYLLWKGKTTWKLF